MKKTFRSDAVGNPYGSVTTVNRGMKHEYREGKYTFHYGVVTFYCEDLFSSFSFVYAGRIHSMHLNDIGTRLTDRQLIVRAGKFGRAVVKTYSN